MELFLLDGPGRKKIPVLLWRKIVNIRHVAMKCAGRSVGVQLSCHGWRVLRCPGDCWLGLQSHEGKSEQCGRLVLPG